MVIRILLATALLVLGTQINGSAALQCHSCSITGCSDPFNENANGVTKVTSLTGWCAKVKATTAAIQTVFRGPDILPCSKNGCDKTSYNGAESTLCCCNSELCNAASRSTSMMIIPFFISCLILHLTKYFY